MNRMNTMTTERPQRDKHPARSARILSTGIALSATLGLTATYAISARAAKPQDPVVEPPLATSGQVLAPLSSNGSVIPVAFQSTTIIAPTQPAPATPVTSSPFTPTPVAPTQVDAASVATPTPIAVTIPIQVPTWTPPQTSGSK